MKVFKIINNFFVEYPLVTFAIILFLGLLPIVVTFLVELDEKQIQSQQEQNKACVIEKVQEYEIESCPDGSKRLVSYNNKKLETSK